LQENARFIAGVKQCQAAADPQVKLMDLDSESACRLLLSTPTITIS